MEQDRAQNTSDSTSESTTTREGATPIDADDATTGNASYEMADKGGRGSGGGEDSEDEHAATPVGGDSTNDTHEATAVGGGTIYSTATDDATEEPLDASGMQPGGGSGGTPPSGEPNFAEDTGGSGTNVRRPPGTDIRGEPIPGYEEGAGSTDSSDSSYAVREGVTRAIDDDDIELRRDQELTAEQPHTRGESVGGFDPDAELARPPDLRHSGDVTNVAPDGTTIGRRTLTSPTGEAVGGSTLSDDIRSQAGELGGDALGRGLDFDLTVPGTQDMGSGPGGRETTGDPNVDRAISANDGSQISADGAPPAPGGGGPGAAPVDQELEDEIQMLIEEEEYEPEAARDKAIERRSRREEEYENPDADSGDSVTNLERVTVMQGSQVQPSNNPDDPATGVSTENYIPPEDLVTMPAQDGETTATTLTSAATLGTSPVTNPSDPVLGDGGIIAGGTYGGSGGSGGGDTIDSMTAMSAGDGSAATGDRDANLPIERAPAGGGSPDALVAGDSGMKMDVNNVSVDMATGQVVGSAALGDDAALAIGAADATLGGESLGAPGGLEGPPPIGEESPPPDGDDG